MDLSWSLRFSRSPEDAPVLCSGKLFMEAQFCDAFYVICFLGSLLDLIIVKQDI